MTQNELPRIPYDQVLFMLERAMWNLGLPGDRAELCARLFAETTRDGVLTHGINRFPRFAAQVKAGAVNPEAEPVLVEAMGALERWDGRQGPGNVNAWLSMERAISLAGRYGIGCVALANTNHWMRGGTFGWQAAERGFVAICWTNTMPNVPPWGGTEVRLGNNPLVIAVPRTGGPVVLDMATSQFSYGALQHHERTGQPLPVPGGFDDDGKLTTDAEVLLQNHRVLPVGFWKGSGLSLLLDLVATLLSGGKATHEIEPDVVAESSISQVFIAARLSSMGIAARANEIVEEALQFMQSSPRVDPDIAIRFPGERIMETRRESERLGLPVEPDIWAQVVNEAGEGWVSHR